jgi:predicted metal-dependent hydrolase
MKQEAYHSREHDRYNKLLRNHGYPVGRILKRLEAASKWGRENVSQRLQLSQTCAAEHLTATLADAILSDPEILRDADEVMAALWRWHAVEEIEHKAVCYDVYHEIGGKYPERILGWLIFSIFFIGYGVPKVSGVLMDADGTGRWKGRLRVLDFLFRETGMGWRIARNYLKYLRPDFHPWDEDHQHHIDRWNAGFDALRQELGIA